MAGAKDIGGNNPASKAKSNNPITGFIEKMIDQTPLWLQPPIMHAPGGRTLLMLPLTGQVNPDELGGTFNFGKDLTKGGK